MPLRLAPADSPSLPLHVVEKPALAGWLAGRPEAERTWLEAQGFEASLGELRLLPGPDGALAGAVAGYGDARARGRGRFWLARAAASLPAGVWHFDWHLEAGLATDRVEEEALGWLLGSYRYSRYRNAKAPQARLKAPDGVDAARIEAIADGEALTRDLINCPSNDMDRMSWRPHSLPWPRNSAPRPRWSRGRGLPRNSR